MVIISFKGSADIDLESEKEIVVINYLAPSNFEWIGPTLYVEHLPSDREVVGSVSCWIIPNNF